METIPEFRKIYAHIPVKVFLKLKEKGILNSNFDNWLSAAIMEKLKKEGGHDE